MSLPRSSETNRSRSLESEPTDWGSAVGRSLPELRPRSAGGNATCPALPEDSVDLVLSPAGDASNQAMPEGSVNPEATFTAMGGCHAGSGAPVQLSREMLRRPESSWGPCSKGPRSSAAVYGKDAHGIRVAGQAVVEVRSPAA